MTFPPAFFYSRPQANIPKSVKTATSGESNKQTGEFIIVESDFKAACLTS